MVLQRKLASRFYVGPDICVIVSAIDRDEVTVDVVVTIAGRSETRRLDRGPLTRIAEGVYLCLAGWAGANNAKIGIKAPRELVCSRDVPPRDGRAIPIDTLRPTGQEN